MTLSNLPRTSPTIWCMAPKYAKLLMGWTMYVPGGGRGATFGEEARPFAEPMVNCSKCAQRQPRQRFLPDLSVSVIPATFPVKFSNQPKVDPGGMENHRWRSSAIMR